MIPVLRPREIKYLSQLRNKPKVMETNELPEDVKAKIEDKLNKGAELVKSLGLDKQVPNGFLDLLSIEYFICDKCVGTGLNPSMSTIKASTQGPICLDCMGRGWVNESNFSK